MLRMSCIIVLQPLIYSALSLTRVSIGNKTFDIETIETTTITPAFTKTSKLTTTKATAKECKEKQDLLNKVICSAGGISQCLAYKTYPRGPVGKSNKVPNPASCQRKCQENSFCKHWYWERNTRKCFFKNDSSSWSSIKYKPQFNKVQTTDH